jgi:hypothetical protein
MRRNSRTQDLEVDRGSLPERRPVPHSSRQKPETGGDKDLGASLPEPERMPRT